MEEILNQLFSPVFWVLTVFLGIVFGIMSNLATDGLKRLAGKFWSSQRIRNEKEAAYIEAQAKRCIESPLHFALISSDVQEELSQLAAIGVIVTIFAPPVVIELLSLVGLQHPIFRLIAYGLVMLAAVACATQFVSTEKLHRKIKQRTKELLYSRVHTLSKPND